MANKNGEPEVIIVTHDTPATTPSSVVESEFLTPTEHAKKLLDELPNRLQSEIAAIDSAMAQLRDESVTTPKLKTKQAAQVYHAADVEAAAENAKESIRKSGEIVNAFLGDAEIVAIMTIRQMNAFVERAFHHPDDKVFQLPPQKENLHFFKNLERTLEAQHTGSKRLF